MSIHDCLWTGIAIRKWDGEAELTLEVSYQDGAIVPAMPATLLQPELLRKLEVWVKYTDVKGMHLYEGSISKTATRIPIEVDEGTEPELYQRTKTKDHGLANLFPVELVRQNIGSNRGFIRVFRRYLDQLTNERPKRYGIIMADVDIFQRILKVQTYNLRIFFYCTCCTSYFPITLHKLTIPVI